VNQRIERHDPEYAHPESVAEAELRRAVHHAVLDLAGVPSTVAADALDRVIPTFDAASRLARQAATLMRRRADQVNRAGGSLADLGRILYPTAGDGFVRTSPAMEWEQLAADRLDELSTMEVSSDPVAQQAVDALSEAEDARVPLPPMTNAPYAGATSDLLTALAAVEAVDNIDRQLKRELLHIATQARAAGTPWAALAVLLRLHPSDEDDPAGFTFSLLRGGDDPFDDLAVTWRCSTCGETVTDRHPANGVDAESGHADDCARHAAQLAQAQAEQDREDTQ
jgi:hypothetical protein